MMKATQSTLTLIISILMFFSSIGRTQDLVIENSVTIQDSSFVLAGNLIIRNGGSLYLDQVSLTMDCSFNGQFGIHVEQGGKLFIYNHSSVSSSNPDARFSFAVHGDTFEMTDSELHGAGWGEEFAMDNDEAKVMAGNKGLVVTTDNALIRNNLFADNHVGLIVADSGALISKNEFRDNFAQALFIRDARSCSVIGNILVNDHGSEALCITSDHNNVYAENNITANQGHCIVTGNSNHSIFEFNVLRSFLISFFMIGPGTYNIVRENDIFSHEVAIQVVGWENEIRNNRVTSHLNWMGTGLYMFYAYNCVVEDNIFTEMNEEHGIWLKHSSNNLIRNNQITAASDLERNRSCGILLFNACKFNLIQRNNISGFPRGISINYSSDHNVLNGNVLASNLYYDLILDDADSTYVFDNNQFQSKDSVNIYDNGSNFQDYQGEDPEWHKAEVPEFQRVEDTYISGQQTIENQTLKLGNFILEDGAFLTLRNVTLHLGVNGSGIHALNGSRLEIHNCKFLEDPYSGGFGLVAGGGCSFVMKDSELSGCGWEWWFGGIEIHADSFLLEGNLISETSLFITEGHNGRMINNTLSNMYTGIHFQDNFRNMEIRGNRFEGAFRAGISGTVTGLHIADNHFSQMWGEGICLWGGSNNVISGDTLRHIAEPFAAIDVQEPGALISRNVITDAYHGIIGREAPVSANKILQCHIGIIQSGSTMLDSNLIQQCNMGILLKGGNNSLSSNIVTSCDTGVFIRSGALDNSFVLNDFILNGIQSIDPANSLWDNGTLGNFWSDYYGYDKDGNQIGDIPYVVFGENKDRHPLMTPNRYTYSPIQGLVEFENLQTNPITEGESHVEILQIRIQKTSVDSSEQAVWRGLHLDRLGTCDDEDIQALRLYKDLNEDSVIDPGTDLLLASGVFDRGTSTLWLDSCQELSSTPAMYLLGIDISSNIKTDGSTFGLGIQDSTCFLCDFPFRVGQENMPLSTTLLNLQKSATEVLPDLITRSKIFPNPTNGKIIIEITDPFKSDIEIYNSNGSLIYNQQLKSNQGQIDLSSFQKGVYFITIRSKDFISTRKIIKHASMGNSQDHFQAGYN